MKDDVSRRIYPSAGAPLGVRVQTAFDVRLAASGVLQVARAFRVANRYQEALFRSQQKGVVVDAPKRPLPIASFGVSEWKPDPNVLEVIDPHDFQDGTHFLQAAAAVCSAAQRNRCSHP